MVENYGINENSQGRMMGEARRRGSLDQRKAEAIKRNKHDFYSEIGLYNDSPDRQALLAGLRLFLRRMTDEEWSKRRAEVIRYLQGRKKNEELAETESIRVRQDEMGWYLFLCEQSLHDPLCVDVSQSQRILPYFSSLGARWHHATSVVGIERKLDEMLNEYRKQPDGHFFELLVALSYAEQGWQVTFIDEVRDQKTPDMRVVKGDQEYFVECKRMSRTTDYSERERNRFLQIWDAGTDALVQNGQWVWCKGKFHRDLFELPDNFLLDLWERALPIGLGEVELLDNEDATIKARLIDRRGVQRHLREQKVKMNSPSLTQAVGGDWAPEDSSVTMLPLIRPAQAEGCEVPELGLFVEDIGFACGFTRESASAISVDKKAKDVKKLLVDAVRQVPLDRPSIIHLAAETMEGREVEHRRTEKLKELMKTFSFGDSPVEVVRLHRLQSHQRAAMLFEIDETVDTLYAKGKDIPTIPRQVVTPQGAWTRSGAHWDVYR